jgi:hypothetical protein
VQLLGTADRSLGAGSLDTLDSGFSHRGHSSVSNHSDPSGQKPATHPASGSPTKWSNGPPHGHHGRMGSSLSWNLPSVAEDCSFASARPDTGDEAAMSFLATTATGSSNSTNIFGPGPAVSEGSTISSSGSGKLTNLGKDDQMAGANALSALKARIPCSSGGTGTAQPNLGGGGSEASFSMTEALRRLQHAAYHSSHRLTPQHHMLADPRSASPSSCDAELSRGSSQLSHAAGESDVNEGLAALLQRLPQLAVSDSEPQLQEGWPSSDCSASIAVPADALSIYSSAGRSPIKEGTATAAARACSAAALRAGPKLSLPLLSDLRVPAGLPSDMEPSAAASPSAWQMYLMYVSLLDTLPRSPNAPRLPVAPPNPLVAFGEQQLPKLCANPLFACVRPSLLAAACMVCARRACSLTPAWPTALSGVTGMLLLQQGQAGSTDTPVKTELFLLCEQVAGTLQLPPFTASAYQRALVHGLDGMLRPERRQNRLTSTVSPECALSFHHLRTR